MFFQYSYLNYLTLCITAYLGKNFRIFDKLLHFLIIFCEHNYNMFRLNYIRDGLIEEFHEGYFVQYSKKNWDNVYPYYLRSCAKPLQAALLIDYNVDLTEKELALCCGSHSGEECHIKVAYQIRKKFGLREENLKCGIHKPLSKTAQNTMLINGEQPTTLHNNCSGKHLGFLAICKTNGWNIDNYDEPSHPLQLEIKHKINSMCKIKDTYPMTTDGCGVPILSMPLFNMLEGYMSLDEKYPQIISAIKNNPYIFGGEDRLDTEIIQNSESLVAKVGAGGLCIVLNTEKKDAFVVKVNDCSMEARRIAVLEIINRLGWANIKYDNEIKTISGKVVGETEFCETV